jgi:glutathione S-transferase
LQKALERGWIEFNSDLLMSNYHMSFETSSTEHAKLKAEFFEDLKKLEPIISPKGPYFRGEEFSLVDTAYAPLFMRVLMLDKLKIHPAWKDMPRVRHWAEELIKLPAVTESVVPDFEKLMREHLKEAGSLLLSTDN